MLSLVPQFPQDCVQFLVRRIQIDERAPVLGLVAGVLVDVVVPPSDDGRRKRVVLLGDKGIILLLRRGCVESLEKD